MSRDYTKIKAYAGQTPLDAKYHYMRDLLAVVCAGRCHGSTCDCPFREMMKPLSAKCCGWLADMDTDRAIAALEVIIGIDYQPEYDRPEVIRAIAEHNGLETSSNLLQEECAELIQAVSKLHRAKRRGDELGEEKALSHLIEEAADVSIMLDEIAALLPEGKYRIARMRDDKLERTVKRYNVRVPGEECT